MIVDWIDHEDIDYESWMVRAQMKPIIMVMMRLVTMVRYNRLNRSQG